jgi:hypothetical protein
MLLAEEAAAADDEIEERRQGLSDGEAVDDQSLNGDAEMLLLDWFQRQRNKFRCRPREGGDP